MFIDALVENNLIEYNSNEYKYLKQFIPWEAFFFIFFILIKWLITIKASQNSRMITYSQEYLLAENGKRNSQIKIWTTNGYPQIRAKFKLWWLNHKSIYQMPMLIHVKATFSHIVWKWRYQKKRWIKCMALLNHLILLHHNLIW